MLSSQSKLWKSLRQIKDCCSIGISDHAHFFCCYLILHQTSEFGGERFLFRVTNILLSINHFDETWNGIRRRAKVTIKKSVGIRVQSKRKTILPFDMSPDEHFSLMQWWEHVIYSWSGCWGNSLDAKLIYRFFHHVSSSAYTN